MNKIRQKISKVGIRQVGQHHFFLYKKGNPHHSSWRTEQLLLIQFVISNDEHLVRHF